MDVGGWQYPLPHQTLFFFTTNGRHDMDLR